MLYWGTSYCIWPSSIKRQRDRWRQPQRQLQSQTYSNLKSTRNEASNCAVRQKQFNWGVESQSNTRPTVLKCQRKNLCTVLHVLRWSATGRWQSSVACVGGVISNHLTFEDNGLFLE